MANPKSELSLADGVLQVTCTSQDPGFRTQELPDAAGPVELKIRMKIATNGAGQVFWSSSQQRGFAGHSVDFDLQHDGQWQEYAVALPVQGKLVALRIDPGQAAGTIQIDWIELTSPDGSTLKRWNFDANEPE